MSCGPSSSARSVSYTHLDVYKRQTFNGLGLREGIYTFLFVPVGVPAATAVSMSLAFYFLRFSAGLLGGLMIAIRSVVQFVRAPQQT